MKLRDLFRYVASAGLTGALMGALVASLLAASPAVYAVGSSNEQDTIEGLLAADTPPEPIDLLKFLAEQRRQMAFAGMAVYTTQKMLTPIKVIHDFDSGIERERITLMDGNMSEIVRTDDEILCLLPDGDILVLEAFLPGGGLPGLLNGQALQAAQKSSGVTDADALMQYTVKGAGRTRIADRDAQRAILQAVDHWRYSYEMLIDRDTGLLLQSSLLSDTGQVLEQFRFTDIDLVRDIPASAFETVQTDGQRVRVPHELPALKPSDDAALLPESDAAPATEMSTQVSYALEWLPAGFMKIRTGGPLLLAVESPLILSDGLAQITVFLDHYDPETMASGASTMGSTNAYTFPLLPVGGDVYAITAIGEVPSATVRKVAESAVRSMAMTHD